MPSIEGRTMIYRPNQRNHRYDRRNRNACGLRNSLENMPPISRLLTPLGCGATGTAKPIFFRARRGALTVEALFIIPIILLITIAIIEFGILLSIQHSVVLSAMKGAREAGKGADIDDLVVIVNEKLAPHNLAVGTSVAVRLEDLAASTDVQQGDPACNPLPSTPGLQAGDVRVTVCVNTTSLPLMNQLNDFGFSLAGLLQRSAVVKRERPI
jgi:hypothetical protein